MIAVISRLFSINVMGVSSLSKYTCDDPKTNCIITRHSPLNVLLVFSSCLHTEVIVLSIRLSTTYFYLLDKKKTSFSVVK